MFLENDYTRSRKTIHPLPSDIPKRLLALGVNPQNHLARTLVHSGGTRVYATVVCFILLLFSPWYGGLTSIACGLHGTLRFWFVWLSFGFEEHILAQLWGFYMLAFPKLVTEHLGIFFLLVLGWWEHEGWYTNRKNASLKWKGIVVPVGSIIHDLY